MNVVYIIVGAVGGLAILFAVLKKILGGLSVKAQLGAWDLWSHEGIVLADKSANFFGFEGATGGGLRGNVALLLTDAGVRHVMWAPRREFTVDWARITGVETVKSFKGKSIFRPLVKISFINEKGETDAAAWFVRDHDVWIKRIKSRIEKGN